ncbi:hypothetical protein L3C95_04515 [Chitinophaga filiformis]|uniref:hypothetical protein n=1 Tax=Chitinophaga filiformis TaxID=104663 RepID=UPI001F1D44EB|nr:hypothetical protein [Chitinophaga filiformis]MCF6402124.1 hypothetical protein [Chitinophaga filiformis]
MKRTTIEKFSMLGLILTATSMVTAAIIPDRKSHGLKNGTLRVQSASVFGLPGVVTCIPDRIDSFYTCTATADTITTAKPATMFIDESIYVDDLEFMWHTINNTSQDGRQSVLQFVG